MDDNTKPFVILDLDKPRKFRFDLNAIIELKERTSINLLDAEQGAAEAFADPKNMRTFIYLGLQTSEENKDITEEIVGEYITLDNFADLASKIIEPFTGKNAPRATIPSRRASRGTGKSPSKRPVNAGSSQASSTS